MSNLDYRNFLQRNAKIIINNNLQLYHGDCNSIEDLSFKKNMLNKKFLQERNNELRNIFLSDYENYSKKYTPVLVIKNYK
tara:strand:+ start:304 stop:543 length:240 start_codon:yes stop_codon:yes gene_type:complete